MIIAKIRDAGSFRRRAKAREIYFNQEKHFKLYRDDWVDAEERKIRQRQPFRAFFGLFKPMLKPPGYPVRADPKSQRVQDEARHRVGDRIRKRRKSLGEYAFPGTPEMRAREAKEREEKKRSRFFRRP
ncbi:MAG: hypothetical protein AAGH41_02680 [Pseudomonadota bacterium]